MQDEVKTILHTNLTTILESKIITKQNRNRKKDGTKEGEKNMELMKESKVRNLHAVSNKSIYKTGNLT